MTLPDPAHIDAGDDKARAALSRYQLEMVESADSPSFPDTFGALDGEFGPRGEIERREVVVRWLARGPGAIDGLRWRYALIAARDGDELAGARDCHVTVDVERRECVVYLAHTLVLPPHRRGGLSGILRAAPVTLAREAVAGLKDAHILLAAEMEPADMTAADTLVRLVAYGRAGFSAVGAKHLPYCQPDFRDLEALGATARPLPLVPVVRWIGHEREAFLPAALCEAYVRHLYAVFGTHCRPADLRRPRNHALAALRASGIDPVPLLPLPRAIDDTERLAPLLRSAVLPHHLPECRGTGLAR